VTKARSSLAPPGDDLAPLVEEIGNKRTGEITNPLRDQEETIIV